MAPAGIFAAVAAVMWRMHLTRAGMHVWLLPRPYGACWCFTAVSAHSYVADAPGTCLCARLAAATPSWRIGAVAAASGYTVEWLLRLIRACVHVWLLKRPDGACAGAFAAVAVVMWLKHLIRACMHVWLLPRPYGACWCLNCRCERLLLCG